MIARAAADDIKGFLPTQSKITNIAQNVLNGLSDPSTLAELAAHALLYFQVGFPAISVKKNKPDQLQMQDVYNSTSSKLTMLSDDASPLLSCNEQVFTFGNNPPPSVASTSTGQQWQRL